MPALLRLAAARTAARRASAASCCHRWGRPAVLALGRRTLATDSTNEALFGTAEPPLPPPKVLRYGGLRVEVVPNVGVGAVTYEGAEICRGINFLYRDEGWGTPPLVLESSEVVRHPVTSEAESVAWTSIVDLKGSPIISFDVVVSVRAAACDSGAPSLSVDVTGHILKPCATSRFGFVVLHPLTNLVGEPVDVIRADGSADAAVFPVSIPPDEVFTDIAGLEHAVAPGSAARVAFSFAGAELYEMEDQRQWLDGSYKTYFRPLSQTPLPYPLSPGDTVRQAVGLTISNPSPDGAAAAEDAPTATAPAVILGGLLPAAAPLPKIGVGVPPAHAEATAAAMREGLLMAQPVACVLY